MKTRHFFMSMITAAMLVSCGGESTESTESTEAEPAEEEGQPIETPGFEGTLKGPEYVTIRNINHVDSTGNVTKNPLIEITDELEFEIEITSLTIDSVCSQIEKSGLDVFGRYIEKGDNYFIAKTSDFMKEPDSIFKVGVFVTHGNVTYYIHDSQEIATEEGAKTVLEYARAYKPKGK